MMQGGLTLTLSMQVSGSLGCVGDVWGRPSICISGVSGAVGAQ